MKRSIKKCQKDLNEFLVGFLCSFSENSFWKTKCLSENQEESGSNTKNTGSNFQMLRNDDVFSFFFHKKSVVFSVLQVPEERYFGMTAGDSGQFIFKKCLKPISSIFGALVSSFLARNRICKRRRLVYM